MTRYIAKIIIIASSIPVTHVQIPSIINAPPTVSIIATIQASIDPTPKEAKNPTVPFILESFIMPCTKKILPVAIRNSSNPVFLLWHLAIKLLILSILIKPKRVFIFNKFIISYF